MEYPLTISVSSKYLVLEIHGFKIYRLEEFTFLVKNESNGFQKIYPEVMLPELVERIEEVFRQHMNEDFESIVEYPETTESPES